MSWGRSYFAVQAVAGAAWWIAVALSPFVRQATLGDLNPLLLAAFDIPLFVVASALAALGVRIAAWVSTGWTVLVAAGMALYATITTGAGWGALTMFAAAGASVIALSLLILGRVPTTWIVSGPFAFRLARPGRSRAAHVAATFGQIVLFWGFFLVVLPLVIAFIEQRWRVTIAMPPGVRVAGLVVLALASAVGIWAGISMSMLGNGTPLPAAMPRRLVIAGPYRYVRNPMALAGIVQGAAVGFILSSWLVVVYAVAGSLLWNFAVRPHEEADLELRFGDEFARYRGAVRCWVPRVPAAADDLF
ncbi:MAG: isoprenylcysteine carboxylmethyltransferase family protein [Rhodoglobus sp.]